YSLNDRLAPWLWHPLGTCKAPVHIVKGDYFHLQFAADNFSWTWADFFWPQEWPESHRLCLPKTLSLPERKNWHCPQGYLLPDQGFVWWIPSDYGLDETAGYLKHRQK